MEQQQEQNQETSTVIPLEKVEKKKTINKDNKYDLQTADEHIFKKWEENYNINVSNNFFGNWLKYSNFVNFQWKKFKDKPLIVVFAGPSLDDNIKELKKLNGKATIMCVDVIVFKLLEIGIKPDIVVNVDPQNIVRFWDGWNGDGSVFIAPVTTHPENMKEWKGKKHLYNTVDYLYKGKHEALKKLTKATKDFGDIANAGFVGATILQVIKDLYPRPPMTAIIGADFAFSWNKAYCSGFLDRRYPGNNRNEEKNKEFKKEISVKADGNTVWTSHQLMMYMDIFKKITENYNLKIINCTDGGILKETEKISRERFKDVVEKITSK